MNTPLATALRAASLACALAATALLPGTQPRSIAAEPAPSAWTTDLPAAQARAKAEKKHVLIDFTGSDWCGWCIKMKKETLSRKPFLDYAGTNLVLVEIDFPQRKRQTAALKKANEALSEKFKVESFPSLVLLDPEGRELGRTEYVAGGPDAFIARLESFKARAAATPAAKP